MINCCLKYSLKTDITVSELQPRRLVSQPNSTYTYSEPPGAFSGIEAM